MSMGEQLRKRVDGTGDEVWEYAQELREEHGDHGVATACKSALDVAVTENELAVLEGSRNSDEAEYLAEELDHPYVIVYFTAEFQQRVDWFYGREGRDEDYETRKDAADALQERTRREREAGAAFYEVVADYKVNNNGSIDDLDARVDQIITDILYL